ncbi:MAG: hypothetical protein AAGJ32_04995 [Pseudomonadota bacterium]
MVTDEELEIARRIAAEVVLKMGDKYWPIFEMVDAECARRAERRARLDKCLSEKSDMAGTAAQLALPATGARSGKALSIRRNTSAS